MVFENGVENIYKPRLLMARVQYDISNITYLPHLVNIVYERPLTLHF